MKNNTPNWIQYSDDPALDEYIKSTAKNVIRTVEKAILEGQIAEQEQAENQILTSLARP